MPPECFVEEVTLYRIIASKVICARVHVTLEFIGLKTSQWHEISMYWKNLGPLVLNIYENLEPC